jgi:hypothetical protein
MVLVATFGAHFQVVLDPEYSFELFLLNREIVVKILALILNIGMCRASSVAMLSIHRREERQHISKPQSRHRCVQHSVAVLQ